MNLILLRLKLLAHLVRHRKEIINDDFSYYPEKRRKSQVQVFADFVKLIVRKGHIYQDYYNLGLDVEGSDCNNYVDYIEYMNRRNMLNLTKPYSYVCLLRDKTLFSIVGSHWGFPVTNDLGLLQSGVLVESKYTSLDELLNANHHIFVKPKDAKKGENVFCVEFVSGSYFLNKERKDKEELFSLVIECSKKTDLIIQEKLIQHSEISKIYPNAINTMRVVTINDKHSEKYEDVFLLGAQLRVGAGGSVVDNVALGGMKVGIDENGCLMEYGFLKREYGTKVTEHPDTHITFKGYKIPFFQEAVAVCKKFHAKLNHVHLIGWDVALTENGPVLIEGNDDSGTDFQVIRGPMKDVYDRYLRV